MAETGEPLTEVDGITLDPKTGEVVLVLFGPPGWGPGHLEGLEDRLNNYVGFVDSGELREQFPAAAGRKVRIQLVSPATPSATGIAFVEEAKAFLGDAGISLEVVVSEDAEEEADEVD